jgi:hypothetical protein
MDLLDRLDQEIEKRRTISQDIIKLMQDWQKLNDDFLKEIESW